jgi:hypothetical protein
MYKRQFLLSVSIVLSGLGALLLIVDFVPPVWTGGTLYDLGIMLTCLGLLVRSIGGNYKGMGDFVVAIGASCIVPLIFTEMAKFAQRIQIQFGMEISTQPFNWAVLMLGILYLVLGYFYRESTKEPENED